MVDWLQAIHQSQETSKYFLETVCFLACNYRNTVFIIVNAKDYEFDAALFNPN